MKSSNFYGHTTTKPLLSLSLSLFSIVSFIITTTIVIIYMISLYYDRDTFLGSTNC